MLHFLLTLLAATEGMQVLYLQPIPVPPSG